MASKCSKYINIFENINDYAVSVETILSTFMNDEKATNHFFIK